MRGAGWWARRSLRFRLTALATLVLGVGLLVGALALSAVLTGTRVAAVDRLAADRAAAVAELARLDRLPELLPAEQPGEVVQVLTPDGRVVATSATASRTLPLVPPQELGRLDRHAGATLDGTAYDTGPVRAAVRDTSWRGSPAVVVATVPLGDVLDAFAAVRLALLVVVPVLALGVGAVLWVLLGRALQPVDDLRRGAERVQSLGGGGTLPVPPGGDEIAALAVTLNSMLDRLQRASERQGAFVADAAHELRSPVAALRATVEVAEAHPEAYDTAELARTLSGEVRRLGRVVEDLLVLARLGSAPRADRDVDLAELARSVAPGPGAPVEVHGSGWGRGDPEALRRVLRNLVENARRYARTGVVVTVGDGRVVVDDDGPGIPAADRERVFERFTRLDGSRARDAGGSGLGLSIARETARELGGDVAAGEAPGGGARLELTVPAAPRPARPGEAGRTGSGEGRPPAGTRQGSGR